MTTAVAVPESDQPGDDWVGWVSHSGETSLHWSTLAHLATEPSIDESMAILLAAAATAQQNVDQIQATGRTLAALMATARQNVDEIHGTGLAAVATAATAARQIIHFGGHGDAEPHRTVLYVEDAVGAAERAVSLQAMWAAIDGATDCATTRSSGLLREKVRELLKLDRSGPSKPARTAWDDLHAYRMVPTSKATLVASEVQTQQDMGAALRLLREEASLTIDQLYNKVKPWNIAGTRRSTIGRVFNGGTLCATREALAALVTACGVDDTDAEVWVAAWERARASQNPRGRRPATSASSPDSVLVDHSKPGSEHSGESVVEVNMRGGLAADDSGADTPRDFAVADTTTETAHSTEPSTAVDTVGAVPGRGDDEVIGTVQITRGHLRTAVVLSALAGLAATSSQAPGVRNAGAFVLGVAGSLALLDMLRNSTTTGPAELPREVPKAA